jgi:hypothetical protein
MCNVEYVLFPNDQEKVVNTFEFESDVRWKLLDELRTKFPRIFFTQLECLIRKNTEENLLGLFISIEAKGVNPSDAKVAVDIIADTLQKIVGDGSEMGTLSPGYSDDIFDLRSSL